MIGFWRCKGLNLNVQLYIYSFILFKLSDSLYCALSLHKNELFLTVDIENDACVPPGVIS